MAGIQFERMLHGGRNKYGELVSDVPQRGEVVLGPLKDRRKVDEEGRRAMTLDELCKGMPRVDADERWKEQAEQVDR